jgi:two-component system CheB/CheR fusion protein
LDALAQFLAQVPKASGLAYVIVQHLDPTHPAMLCTLLQRVTSLPVAEAEHSMRILPDAVYVIPPNSELTVEHDTIRLTVPSQPRGMRLPVDALFLSLARSQTDRAIGVVLSGMGSDGTLGLLAIKRQRGVTLAQTPDSAQFSSMPANAIAAGCVDIVAAPGDMPARICRLLEDGASAPAGPPASAAPSSLSSSPPPGGSAESLQSILSLLRERSRHDLSSYKTSTLLRRIERRMAVHGLVSMNSYEELLRANPGELELMFREMLIGVTSFFRDPPVWQQLKESVLPRMLARRTHREALRAWVVGCSTGEEAYSLAMVFQELIMAQPDRDPPALQIFASDLSADAIEFARKGRYPGGIRAATTPSGNRCVTWCCSHSMTSFSIRPSPAWTCSPAAICSSISMPPCSGA